MKKISILLFIFYCFFIGFISAYADDGFQDFPECNLSTIYRYNGLRAGQYNNTWNGGTVGDSSYWENGYVPSGQFTPNNERLICDYRPLALQGTESANYIQIYVASTSSGNEVFYVYSISEYQGRQSKKMILCSTSREEEDGYKYFNTETYPIQLSFNRNDGSWSDLVAAYYSFDDAGVIDDSIRVRGSDGMYHRHINELLHGFVGTEGLSVSTHDNRYYCPSHAGVVYPTVDPNDPSGDVSETISTQIPEFAYATLDYDGNTAFPQGDLNNSNSAYRYNIGFQHILTNTSEDATSDSWNSRTGERTDTTTVARTQAFQQHTNDSIRTATNRTSTAKDWDSCNQYGVLKTLDIVHISLSILKVLVPIVLIIFGSIDFGKATISGDDDLVGKATKTLIRRGILGIIIFFVPTITYSVVGLIGDQKTEESSFLKCEACFTGDKECDTYLQQADSKVDLK